MSLVFLKYVCPFCDHEPYQQPRSLIQHLNRYHSQNLQARKPSTRRPNLTDYHNVPSEIEADECHAACPSCWLHFPEADRQAFINHLDTVHAGTFQLQVQVNEPFSMEADTAGSSGGNSSTVAKHKDDASTRRKLEFFDALDNLVVAVKKLVLNCD